MRCAVPLPATRNPARRERENSHPGARSAPRAPRSCTCDAMRNTKRAGVRCDRGVRERVGSARGRIAHIDAITSPGRIRRARGSREGRCGPVTRNPQPSSFAAHGPSAIHPSISASPHTLAGEPIDKPHASVPPLCSALLASLPSLASPRGRNEARDARGAEPRSEHERARFWVWVWVWASSRGCTVRGCASRESGAGGTRALPE